MLGGTTYREPECEVTERPRDFLITARLPGVRRAEIELTLGRRTLRLRAEHRAKEQCLRRGVAGWHAAQRSYFRAFRLPVKVHPEAAKVAFRKGVLRVRLPKCQPRRMPSWLVG